MNDKEKWQVWSVNVKHYKKIQSFISTITAIKDSLIPIMEKEYIDKRNSKKRIKSIPLYGNYIFLKYESSDHILNLLTQNQLFYRYLGECTSEEAVRIEEFKFRNYREFFEEDDLEEGMCVKLVTPPFKNIVGRVESVNGHNVSVILEFFGQPVEIRCKLNDLRTELWSAGEED